MTVPGAQEREAAAHTLAVAVQEADSALVCLQAGRLPQATSHLARGEAVLEGRSLEESDIGEAVAAGKRGAGGRAIRRRLARLNRALNRHPAKAALAPSSPLDGLKRRGRVVAAACAILLVLGGLLFRAEPGAVELRSAGAILPVARQARIKLTEAQVLARFPNGHFRPMDTGFTFGEEAEVRLTETRPVYLLKIVVRSAMIQRIKLLHRGEVRYRFLLGPRIVPLGLMEFKVDLSGTRATEGVDTILIQGIDGDGAFALGPIWTRDY